MLHRPVAVGILLIFTLAPGVLGPSVAEGDRPDTVSLSDSSTISRLEAARLLVAFGEPRRAYSLTPGMSFDPGVDRERLHFEVRLMTELKMYEQADSLLAVAAPLVVESKVYDYYLQRAFLNLLAGRYGRVLDCLAYLDGQSDVAFDAYVAYVAMRANLGLSRPEAAVAAGERGMAGDLPPSLTPEFELILVEAYSAAGRPQDALVLLEVVKRRARRSADRAALMELEYRLRIEAADVPEARKTAASLSKTYRRREEAKRVGLDLLDRVPPRKLDSQELLVHAGAMTDHGQFRAARELLRALDDRDLTSWQREHRSIIKARYYYHTGDYRRSIALAKPRFTSQGYRRESMLILARSYRSLGEKRKAADVYTYFAKTFPNDTKSAEALYVAARLYESSGDPRSAQGSLYRLRTSYPSSYYGSMASYRGAEYYAETGRLDTCVEILEGAVRRSRKTDPTAMYYLAAAYGAAGRISDKNLLLDELQDLKPRSFYLNPQIPLSFRRPPTTSTGEVALDGGGGLLTYLTAVTDRKARARAALIEHFGGPGTGTEMPDEAEACVRRGRWFLDAGFRDWGEKELEKASLRCYESPLAMLELAREYDEYGLPFHGIRLYQRVKDSIHWKQRRDYTEDFGYLMYPVPYPVQVLENAARHDLPPHLVYALIREESRFDRSAVSRVGALGLMQLMPETARHVARELEMPDWGDENILDPEINLSFGMWYASSLLKSSNGNHLRMLAAYNAGPANAKRWFHGKDADEMIEAVDGIEFKETRLYVQRIVESANIYHDLYFQPSSSGADSPGGVPLYE